MAFGWEETSSGVYARVAGGAEISFDWAERLGNLKHLHIFFNVSFKTTTTDSLLDLGREAWIRARRQVPYIAVTTVDKDNIGPDTHRFRSLEYRVPPSATDAIAWADDTFIPVTHSTIQEFNDYCLRLPAPFRGKYAVQAWYAPPGRFSDVPSDVHTFTFGTIHMFGDVYSMLNCVRTFLQELARGPVSEDISHWGRETERLPISLPDGMQKLGDWDEKKFQADKIWLKTAMKYAASRPTEGMPLASRAAEPDPDPRTYAQKLTKGQTDNLVANVKKESLTVSQICFAALGLGMARLRSKKGLRKEVVQEYMTYPQVLVNARRRIKGMENLHWGASFTLVPTTSNLPITLGMTDECARNDLLLMAKQFQSEIMTALDNGQCFGHPGQTNILVEQVLELMQNSVPANMPLPSMWGNLDDWLPAQYTGEMPIEITDMFPGANIAVRRSLFIAEFLLIR